MSRLLHCACPHTSGLLLRLQKHGKLVECEAITKLLGDVEEALVDRWVLGDELPPLHILPRLAEIADINPECLVLTWLSDSDPANDHVYETMATQLIKAGGPTANPFFKVPPLSEV